MQTRQELYELLDYDPAAENWPGLMRTDDLSKVAYCNYK